MFYTDQSIAELHLLSEPDDSDDNSSDIGFEEFEKGIEPPQK